LSFSICNKKGGTDTLVLAMQWSRVCSIHSSICATYL